MNDVTKELLEILGFPKEDTPICIETGTHRGEGSETFSKYFNTVYTIELSESLYNFSKENM
jgi:hypothetical protein